MDDRTVRAPLGVVAPSRLVFSDDAIIRTDGPTTLRCGGAEVPPLGTNCRAGCRTKDHQSYDACLKAANTTTYLASPSKGLDGTGQKAWDKELSDYRDARRQGMQPDGTTKTAIEKAVRLSDQAGAAYGRDFSMADPMAGG